MAVKAIIRLVALQKVWWNAGTRVHDTLSDAVIEPDARRDDVSLPRQVHLRRVPPSQNRIGRVRRILTSCGNGPVLGTQVQVRARGVERTDASGTRLNSAWIRILQRGIHGGQRVLAGTQRNALA